MYRYYKCGNHYEIFEDEYKDGVYRGAHKVDGERVYLPTERIECKKRVYELNGWKWKD